MGNFLDNINKKINNPAAIIALGLGTIILIGALLLNLSLSTLSGDRVGFINALFTASSALCVTGLSVVNTAATWSLFGQAIILMLIQIGGLGFMTLTTIVLMFLGKKINLSERLILKEQYNQESMGGLLSLTKNIICFTFIIEMIGAILLSTRFIPIYGLSKGIWFSIFHSISGFCNAGFDIIGDSLTIFSGDPIIMLTLALLIILGGIGYSVVNDWRISRKFSRISLHSKLATVVTGSLLLLGSIVFFFLEKGNPGSIEGMSILDKLLNSFFQSTTTRTAGFYSVNFEILDEATAFFFILLMFIGGSPASTAGGIKTTTIGVIALSTLSTIKGEEDLVIFKKRIGDKTVKKSLAIIFISLLLIVTVSFILTVTEDALFLDILFETTSAFTTVGLSRGITSNLSDIGKLILSLAMYVGRVGPLTMGIALGKRSKSVNIRYSEGHVMIG